MELPKISVIIPVYNRSEFLADAMDSAVNQTFMPFEILVVDDGSEPGHADVIRSVVEQNPMSRLLRLPENQGVSFARNEGLAQAVGEFVVFLDDDDFLEEKLLNAAAMHFLEHPHSDALITKTRLFSTSPNKAFRRSRRFYAEHQDRYHREVSHPDYFIDYCPAIHSLVFRKTSLPPRPFPEHLRFGEDRWLLLSLKRQGFLFHTSDLLGAQYTMHAGQKIDWSDRLIFLDALISSGWLTGSQQSYLLFLKSYYSFRAGHPFPAIAQLGQAMKHPAAAWPHFRRMLKLA